jgi:alpha-galactosidase
MLNMLGYSYRLPELPKWCLERISYHSKLYKEVTGRFIKEGDIYHLTGQALDGGGGDRWNSFLYIMENKEEAIAFVFRLPGGESERKIVLKGLINDAVYQVRFEDSGVCCEISGKDLMENGMTFNGMKEESSEIVYITKVKQL